MGLYFSNARGIETFSTEGKLRVVIRTPAPKSWINSVFQTEKIWWGSLLGSSWEKGQRKEQREMSTYNKLSFPHVFYTWLKQRYLTPSDSEDTDIYKWYRYFKWKESFHISLELVSVTDRLLQVIKCMYYITYLYGTYTVYICIFSIYTK